MPKPDDSPHETIDLKGMREYLSQTEVVFAVLFGSHARGEADTSSDVDIALRFPEGISEVDRFHRRNRIDADLQAYAVGFVDVSDIESLPTHVAHAALRDGVRLVGDQQDVDMYKRDVIAEYDESDSQREEERRGFIDRLSRGDV